MDEYLVKWCGLGYGHSTWEMDLAEEVKIADFKRRNTPGDKKVTKAYTQDEYEARVKKWYPDSPRYKSGHQLRDYQVQGLNWLIRLFHEKTNGLLADEMGLGKTVQIVAFFEHLRQVEGLRGPYLVVVPLSTLGHWRKEVENWTNMNVVIYHDSDPGLLKNGKEARKMIRDHEFYYSSEKKTNYYKFHILVTTYEALTADIEELGSIKFKCIVVDEGHRMKNSSGLLHEKLSQLQIERRILLTGTPIQNSTSELWTLLNFLEPVHFASNEIFIQKFGNLQEADQVRELMNTLKPYILRRRKETVEKSIPPKKEHIIEIELTMTQKKYYRAILERNKDFFTKLKGSGLKSQLNNIQMELRKVCNHPWLVDGAENTELPDCTNDEYNTKTAEVSGKMVLLNKLLPKLKREGHRVLIFSQMTKMLDILQEFLISKEYQFERIDGNVDGNQRELSIERFNRPDSEKFVFLLTTRSGGVGLNLATADTVIIYDSDWNPQQDQQALARVHRIGQTRPVSIYRLVTRSTYESEMFLRASKKLGLDDAVLGRLSCNPKDPKDARTMSDDMNEKDAADIERSLRLGAYAFATDDDSKRAKFLESDIDTILSHYTITVNNKGEATSVEDAVTSDAGRVFSNIIFSSDGGDEKINVDDPDFWTKYFPQDPLSKYTPAVLLSQLTEGSLSNQALRNEFFERVKLNADHFLELRRKGESAVGAEDLEGLLIQINSLNSQFTNSQISLVRAWSEELSRRTERKRRGFIFGCVPLLFFQFS